AERDIRTLRRKRERRGAADAARSPRDQRDLSCKLHFNIPRLRHAMLHRIGRWTNVPRMIIARTLTELRAGCTSLRAAHGALALVPTMGALHDGHCALVRAAVGSGAAVVTSIFVNPLQFGASEDLSRYPRDEAGDLAVLRAAGCHLVWLPDVLTMYPPD